MVRKKRAIVSYLVYSIYCYGYLLYQSSSKNFKNAAPTAIPSCAISALFIASSNCSSENIPCLFRRVRISVMISPLNSGCPWTVISFRAMYIPCTAQRGEEPSGVTSLGYADTMSLCICCTLCKDTEIFSNVHHTDGK